MAWWSQKNVNCYVPMTLKCFTLWNDLCVSSSRVLSDRSKRQLGTTGMNVRNLHLWKANLHSNFLILANVEDIRLVSVQQARQEYLSWGLDANWIYICCPSLSKSIADEFWKRNVFHVSFTSFHVLCASITLLACSSFLSIFCSSFYNKFRSIVSFSFPFSCLAISVRHSSSYLNPFFFSSSRSAWWARERERERALSDGPSLSLHPSSFAPLESIEVYVDWFPKK